MQISHDALRVAVQPPLGRQPVHHWNIVTLNHPGQRENDCDREPYRSDYRETLHQFHVRRQLDEFFLILPITVDNFRRNRIKQLFQMTQHAACEMAFSRLGLPTDIKVCRRFKSDIHNGICKLNPFHYILWYL